MKKIPLYALLALIFLASCSQPKPVKTIVNLKAAIKGETTASAKYAAFAVKAKEEGNNNVAKLFEAASKSESLHATNHNKALTKLGEKMEDFKPEFEVKTTAENLQVAIDGESYEVSTMYPQFIVDAKFEKSEDAIKSFSWAFDTEKKHQGFFKTALEALNAGGEKSLQSQWFICPVCGNTFNGATVTETCDFCLTKKDKFIVA